MRVAAITAPLKRLVQGRKPSNDSGTLFCTVSFLTRSGFLNHLSREVTEHKPKN